MTKIGIIFCAYGNPSYVEPCLSPWIKLKQKYNITIAAVHGQFKEYFENDIIDADIETYSILLKSTIKRDIDFLYVQNNYDGNYEDWIYQTEAEIRDKGLQYLLKEKCEFIWLLDLDEFYTEEQIENVIKYIINEENQWFAWFSINFKNYILDGKQWIDGFCPPRIFRNNYHNHINLNKFYYDNDLIYLNMNMELINYKNLPNKQISKDLCYVKHLTWLHSNGKNKVNYQIKHFGHCSYKWNEEKKELEIDYDFYKKNGLNLPIIYKDE